MTNEEKAREIQANDVCCVWNGGCPNVRNGAMKMAQWKDEQYRKKLTMILNAPNEVLRIEWLEALINNEL